MYIATTDNDFIKKLKKCKIHSIIRYKKAEYKIIFYIFKIKK